VDTPPSGDTAALEHPSSAMATRSPYQTQWYAITLYMAAWLLGRMHLLGRIMIHS